MAGAPKGNTNARRGFDARRALEMALDEFYAEEPKELVGRMRTLVNMWKPIIDKALVDGDLAAMKEINDRLDGRAAQSIEHSGEVITKQRELTEKEADALNNALNDDF